MKKRKILIFLTFIIALLLIVNVTTVKADTGPKPTIEIKITNLKQSNYIVGYGIYNKTYYGPHQVFIPGHEEFGETSFGDKSELTVLYNNVKLPEGWNLIDISSSYNNKTELIIKSGYYWPSHFILIIYDSVNNNYYLSKETTTYAFNSYFSFDMNKYTDDDIALKKAITLEKTYNYWKEILKFFVRLIISLAIEIGLAFIFKFTKKSLLIIALTNIGTQIGLNLFLNITTYLNGKSPYFVPLYILIELIIVIIESIIFKLMCKRGEEQSNKFVIIYTILANILSFGLGMILWFVM